MTVETNAFKNKAELSIKINKAVVDYIKNVKKAGGEEPTVSLADIYAVSFKTAGIADPILATKEENKVVTQIVSKAVGVMVEFGALKTLTTIPQNFKEYIKIKQRLVANVNNHFAEQPVNYKISTDFNKKMMILKTNEIIKNSDIINVPLENSNLSVLVVTKAPYEKVKTSNDIFDYSKISKYIGCYNSETKKVDLIATTPVRKAFFATKKTNILPEQKEIISLYYEVNLSEYKKLFIPEESKKQSPIQTILGLKSKQLNKKVLSTDSSNLVSRINGYQEKRI